MAEPPKIYMKGVASSADNFVRLGFEHGNVTNVEGLTQDMAEELYHRLGVVLGWE